MTFRPTILLLLLAWLFSPMVSQAQRLPPDLRVVVLDIEQTGDLGDEAMARRRGERAVRMTAELKRRLAEAGLVTVVDDTPLRSRIDKEKASQLMHRCNGCDLDIARDLRADAVLVGWIFRMSQLVVTMHFELRDVNGGKLLMKRSLDFRNDADDSWSRMLDYLIRDMREGRMHNGAPG